MNPAAREQETRQPEETPYRDGSPAVQSTAHEATQGVNTESPGRPRVHEQYPQREAKAQGRYAIGAHIR
jgi:hypothetical protein